MISGAWVFTDGLNTGASKEIADIFQEDLKRSEWAEVADHANIPLIAFTPWSVLADRSQLMGIYVSPIFGDTKCLKMSCASSMRIKLRLY